MCTVDQCLYTTKLQPPSITSILLAYYANKVHCGKLLGIQSFVEQ